VVEANLAAMRADGVGGEVFNVANTQTYSVNQVYEKIQKLLGVETTPKRGPKREGDVRYTCGDGNKAKMKLGFVPKIGFDEGLALTVDWFRDRAKQT
jgi:nucleoside-diphosphate-sugar epimerase